MAKSSREVLGRSRGRVTIDKWCLAHRKKVNGVTAREFTEAWLQMRADGESDWSGLKVLEYLQETYDFPYTSEAMFLKWCRRTWMKLYKQGVARGEE